MAVPRIPRPSDGAPIRRAGGTLAAALLLAAVVAGGAQAMPYSVSGVDAVRAGIGGAPEDRGAQKVPEVRNAAGDPLDVSDGACKRNLARAAAGGLRLPDGWKLHCVGAGLDWGGGSHWGVTCPYEECPEGEGPYVSISNPTYYVVAHELCHANFGNDELMADACAAKHGASLKSSPYN